MSIPKIIHYCWFGKSPHPELVQKCIESWKKYLPEYEIIEWNEENFDINMNAYVKEAYEAGKYAFVSDVARFYVLNNYGGIYMDTDVEVLRPLDHFLQYEAFMGFESVDRVAPGLIMGSLKGNSVIKEILDLYSNTHFKLNKNIYNLTTVVTYTTNILLKYGLRQNNSFQVIKNIAIFPKEYFCPLTFDDDKVDFTENTYTIHHFMDSWHTEKDKKRIKRKEKLRTVLIRLIGVNGLDKLKELRNKPK